MRYFPQVSKHVGDGRFLSADDLRDVAALEAITTELGVQYNLGYYSHSQASSGARQIKVRVRFPNLVVRTTNSYSTAAAIAQKD